MTTPEISVIMPVYKEPRHFLIQAIDSILSQSYCDFEFIIIVDDPDFKYRELLDLYGVLVDRIRIIYNEENLGLTKSLNKAIACAKGNFIARMDADDISSTGRLKKQYSFLRDNPEYSVVGTDARFINEGGGGVRKFRPFGYTGKITEKMLRRKNRLIHGSVMMNRQDLSYIGGYDESIPYAQDYELWARFVRRRKKIFIMREKLYCLRLHNNSITANKAHLQNMVCGSLNNKESFFARFRHKYQTAKWFMKHNLALGILMLLFMPEKELEKW